MKSALRTMSSTLDKLNAEFLRAFFRQERVIAPDVHAERFGAFGDFAADPAHAENAQHFVAQLDAEERFAVPFAADRFQVGLRDMAGDRHHHGESMLAGRDGVAVRRIDDDNAASRCGFQIDVVDADACASDDFKLFAGFHDAGGHAWSGCARAGHRIRR